MLKHLKDEERTQASAEAITADLAEVICRLVGHSDDAVDAKNGETAEQSDAIFDLIPSSKLRRGCQGRGLLCVLCQVSKPTRSLVASAVSYAFGRRDRTWGRIFSWVVRSTSANSRTITRCRRRGERNSDWSLTRRRGPSESQTATRCSFS